MIRKLIISSLVLLNLLLATAIVNAFWHGTIAQSILSSLQVVATNPTLGAPNSLFSSSITTTYDGGADIATGFPFEGSLGITNTTFQGLNNNNGPSYKSTYPSLAIFGTNFAAGQKINFINKTTCAGMGDCFVENRNVSFATGNIAGDEGTGFESVSGLGQQNDLDLGTITSITTSTCNATTTQSITGGPNVQTVTVIINSGSCSPGSWVVVNPQIASGSGQPYNEAVKITASTGSSISGVFHLSQATSTTIGPAKDITIAFTSGQPGQQRVLLNLNGSSYSTGTIASITGGGLTGSGTGWSNSMVGGNAGNVGCLEMDADTYSSFPFNGSPGTNSGPLKSWYQINAVNSATSLGIFSFSALGDLGYHGKGPGSGTYVVRPCIEILYVLGNSEVITEATSTTWNVGDTIEQVICPYPDVAPFHYDFAVWGPGGTRRPIWQIKNLGARGFGPIIEVENQLVTGGNADPPPAFSAGLQCDASACGSALFSLGTTGPAISLSSNLVGGYGDASGEIVWAGTAWTWGPNSTSHGFNWQATATGNGGLLATTSSDIVGTGTLPVLAWQGMYAEQAGKHFSDLPTCASGTQSYRAFITDANASTFGATISAGGGSNKVEAVCDGTNWTVH